jgi:hypothetical protein
LEVVHVDDSSGPFSGIWLSFVFVWSVFLMVGLAKAFGHGVGMALVLILLTGIGYLVLGFGGSQYQLEEDPLFG